MKKTIGLILVFVSIIMLSVGFYLNNQSPKNLMIKTLASQYKNTNIKYDENYKSKVSARLLLNYNKNVKYNYEKQLDFNSKESKLYSKYILEVINNVFENISSDYKDNNTYIQVNNYYQRIQKINNIRINNNLSTKEINDFISLIINTIIDELQYDRFSQEKCKIKIDNIDLNCYKYNVYFTNKDVLNIYNSIIKRAKNDSKFKKIYNIIVNEQIDKYISQSFDTTLNKKVIEYSIYVLENNNIFMHEIINNTNSRKYFDRIVFSNYQKDNIKYYNISLIKNDISLFDFKFNDNSDYNNVSIVSNEMKFVLSGKITSNEKSTLFNAEIYNLNNKKELIASINYDYSISNINNQSTVSIDIVSSYNGNNIDFHTENVINKK